MPQEKVSNIDTLTTEKASIMDYMDTTTSMLSNLYFDI